MQRVTNIHQNSLCSSVVIDDLYSRFYTADPNIGIACLYADYKDQKNQTLVHILGCFLHQFLTTVQNPIPDEVIEKLDDIRKRGGKAGSEDMLALLNIQLQKLKLGFICIDAVDELDPHVQRQVLDTLKGWVLLTIILAYSSLGEVIWTVKCRSASKSCSNIKSTLALVHRISKTS